MSDRPDEEQGMGSRKTSLHGTHYLGWQDEKQEPIRELPREAGGKSQRSRKEGRKGKRGIGLNVK